MIKKDITFIYMDSAEYSNYLPIADEAERRGYKVKLTTNKFEKCEIGVYCQHINFPQYSKFSVIMLHDIIQQYGQWPDIWIREPWNKYDIGILPSYQWEKNWTEASRYFYAHPTKGVYRAGWPKADSVSTIDRGKYKEDFCNKYGLAPSKKTILYAPAWENDNKQDEFVNAMLPLDVNILIKQYNATEEDYPEQYKAIREMYELHKNNKRVIQLDPKTNIFEAIMAADVLVSEESSTMSEAIMMGIPAVSVSNWLIPDVTPSRFPECNYDFVITTLKENLTNCIKEIINNYSYYTDLAIAHRDKTFCNIGNTSKIIMDIIDDVISDREVRYEPISSRPVQKIPVKRLLKHKYIIWNRELRYNYSVQYPAFGEFWNFIRKIKKIFFKKNIV